MIPCSWKESFGIDCMTCGFQRGFHYLIHGELIESIVTFPATIPLIITFTLLLLHLTFGFNNGAKWLLRFFSFSAALVLFNY
ncbi:MAG: DUF2752 domain-containing protein, partial [Flammeovirgaceae bacterium]